MKHNIKITAIIDDDLLTVKADERKLKQVLVNLLSSSVKFTPEGGSVNVLARRVEGQGLETGDYGLGTDSIEIAVADTGPGIKQEHIPKLFQPFNQLESPFEKKYLGTGLGLALCKNIIELHRGRIWVKSEEGKGSRFIFTIPVTQ